MFVVIALAGTSAAKAAAPAAAPTVARTIALEDGKICVVNTDGTETCYDAGTDPLYTDPTYSCPTGSTPIDGDPAHCTVATSGFIYADRPWIEATLVCPDGYTEVTGGEKPCAQVKEAGHYITAPQPYEDETSCPGPITWSYTYWGHTYTITFSYDKKESDPHKCHRPSDNNTPPHGWPGFVRGKFNSENPEFIDATVTRVYKACSTLGAGWDADPAVEHQCRFWVNTTYDWADKVLGEAAHYGACPTGYDPVPGSDVSCQQPTTGSQTVDALVTSGTPYCAEGTGSLVDGKCRNEIECPPVPCLEGQTYNPDTQSCESAPKLPPEDEKNGRSCNKYYAYLIEVGHPERIDNIPHCKGTASGSEDFFQNLWAQWFGN